MLPASLSSPVSLSRFADIFTRAMLPADGTWMEERVGATGGRGPAPPGARTARAGTHHAPFGINTKGAGRHRLAADRPAARLQGRQQHAGLSGADGEFR